MDGEVDAVERQNLSQLISRDSQAATLWSDLNRDRSMLRSSFVTSEDVRPALPRGFAERVVDAAILRAREEGFEDSHPVVLAGGSPSGRVGRFANRRAGWRSAGWVAAALAASIATIAFWNPTGGEGEMADSGEGTAGTPADTALLAIGPGTLTPNDGPADTAITDDSDTDPFGTIASNGPDRSSLDAAEPASVTNPGNMTTVSKEPLASGVVMVVEVVCKSDADRIDVLRQAMLQSNVSLESRREMSDDLVSVAADATGLDRSQPFEVIFLAASAQCLDQLYLHLSGDSNSVDSIGLTIADDAPIITSVRRLCKDVDNGGSQSIGYPIQQSGAGAQLASLVSDLKFAPMRSVAGLSSIGGADEMSHVIMVLR